MWKQNKNILWFFSSLLNQCELFFEENAFYVNFHHDKQIKLI